MSVEGACMVQNGLVVLGYEMLVIYLFRSWHLAGKDGGSYSIHYTVQPKDERWRHGGVFVDERSETDKNHEIDRARKLELHKLPQVLEYVPSVLQTINHHAKVINQYV